MFHNGKLYILFESASYRFQYGKLGGGNDVCRMALPERGDGAKKTSRPGGRAGCSSLCKVHVIENVVLTETVVAGTPGAVPEL